MASLYFVTAKYRCSRPHSCSSIVQVMTEWTEAVICTNLKWGITFNPNRQTSFYSNVISNYNLHIQIYYKNLVSMETKIFCNSWSLCDYFYSIPLRNSATPPASHTAGLYQSPAWYSVEKKNPAAMVMLYFYTLFFPIKFKLKPAAMSTHFS